MALNRYSLTDYILSVKVPEELREVFLGEGNTVDAASNTISIGGDGSFVGSITVATPNAQWTTEGDVTGSWVHNKSKNQVGTITVSINQISDKALLLERLYSTYYSADSVTEGLSLTLNKATGSGNQELICTGIDCYLANRPDFTAGETATNRDWEFTCGKISYGSTSV